MALYGDAGGSWKVADLERALTNDAFYAALDVLCGTISETPIDVIRSEGPVRIPVASPNVIRRPSALVSSSVWVSQSAFAMFTDGNAFSFITALDQAGRPDSLESISSAQVKDRRVTKGVGMVSIGEKDFSLYPHGEVFHIPGRMMRDGSAFALSPLEKAASAIGISLRAEQFAGQFFADGGHPTGILTSETDPGPDGAKRIKEVFRQALGGTREPVVLPKSVTYQKIQTDPKDSMFIDLLRYSVERVARFMRVPPSMIYGQMSGQSVTYANVSQADLHYMKHSLQTPYNRFEEYLGMLVDPLVVRFNRDAVLRADPGSRADVQAKRLQSKTITVNEVRAQEDQLPFDDLAFDQPGIPGGDKK